MYDAAQAVKISLKKEGIPIAFLDRLCYSIKVSNTQGDLTFFVSHCSLMVYKKCEIFLWGFTILLQ